MLSEETRYRIEANATAICLAFAGACFGVGLLLNHGAKAVDRALTWRAHR